MAQLPLLDQVFLLAATLFICLIILRFPCFSLPPSSPSLRLAYKDLEQDRKREEQKLKGLEGNKREQAERLGMGLGMRR